jgi:hypothetical protein
VLPCLARRLERVSQEQVQVQKDTFNKPNRVEIKVSAVAQIEGVWPRCNFDRAVDTPDCVGVSVVWWSVLRNETDSLPLHVFVDRLVLCPRFKVTAWQVPGLAGCHVVWRSFTGNMVLKTLQQQRQPCCNQTEAPATHTSSSSSSNTAVGRVREANMHL